MNAIFNIKGKIIETNRLILRPFKQTDLSDLYEYASVDGVGEMAGWSHHKNKEESQKILNMFIDEDKVFAICLKENEKVIGSIGVEKYGMEEKLTEFDGYKGREIGYVLSRTYWGKGIATEATKAIIDFLFYECELDFLICGYYNFNFRSKRVQEKCGFKAYRKLTIKTSMNTEEQSILNLLIHPNKKIKFQFSHPETLIYNED